MPDNISFSNVARFHSAVAAVQESSEEQTLIERALGKALLSSLGGTTADLTETYKSLGGKDPAVNQILSAMNTHFAKIKITADIKKAASVAANSSAVAASKGASIKANNPVFGVKNTALNTLSTLGGTEFATKYKIT